MFVTIMMIVYLLLGLMVVIGDAPFVDGRLHRYSVRPYDSLEWEDSDQSDETVSLHREYGLPLGMFNPSLPRRPTIINATTPDDMSMEVIYDGVYQEAWTTCLDSLWVTCVGRCGAELTGAPYVCGCDSECRLYGDCCLDYDLECTLDFHMSNDTEENFLKHMGELDCVSVARDSKYGVLMFSSCADWWPSSNMTKYGLKIQEKCVDPSEDSLHPVVGHRGLIYKNNYCAQCNGVFNAVPWTGETHCGDQHGNTGRAAWLDSCSVRLNLSGEVQDNYRVCTYDVSGCPGNPFERGEIGDEVNEAAIDLCSAYSKPIFDVKFDGSKPMYKNVHCAHCNDVPTGQLYCPAWQYVPTNAKTTDAVNPYLFFETGQEVDEKNQIKEIPASFAILFNFGSNGDGPVPIFSSQQQSWWDTREENCDENELWDPFSEVCRKVYCSSEFSLLDFQCISIYDNASSSDDGVVIPDNVTQALMTMDVSAVLVALSIQLDMCITDEVKLILDSEFVDEFAISLNVSSERFVNFTMGNYTSYLNENSTACPRELQVFVTLLGPDPTAKGPQPSIEMVSASVAYSVSLNHLFLYFDEGVTARVFGVQEKLVKVVNNTNNETEKWCSDGRQVVYQNGDFTPIMHFFSESNYSVDIFINSSGRTYLPGQFLGNIMFQGDQRSTLANVTGIVIVCDLSYDNNTCIGVLINQTEYVPLKNGSIMYVGSNTHIHKIYNPGFYDILPSGMALICLTLIPPNINVKNGIDNMKLMDLQIQSLMSTMLLALSSVAMAITIFTYLSFVELRNLPGKNLINLTFISLVYQLTFLAGMRTSVGDETTVCTCVAIALHYSILASFFWMNVIAYSLYKSFAGDNLMASVGRSRNVFVRYAIYAYGVPFLIVGTCVALDLLPSSNVEIDYGQGGVCWIGNPVALLVAFAGVIAIVLVVNLIFYVLTVRSIRRISRKTELSTGQSSQKNELAIYIRMSSSMGFTWFFGFLSGIPDLPYAAYDVFSYLFVILNTLQGTFIFFAFVCNGKVLALYKNSSPFVYFSSKLRFRRCKSCNRFSCVCQKPIIRTISNETCKSILADSEDVVSNVTSDPNEKRD